MPYYLTHKGAEAEFLGTPFPAVGVRVVFDVERLFAARERLLGRPVDRHVVGDEGLVVHEDPTAVLTLPDRLWRVDHLGRARRHRPTDRWLRCGSLTVVEEVPAWLALGPYGDRVVRVIDQAHALTDEQARVIAARDDARERRLVRELWQRWLPRHRAGSPIAGGLAEVYEAVTGAARRTGPHLFGWDDEDGVEVLTDGSWQQAAAAAGAAALAAGAPGILAAADDRELALRWTHRVGRPRPGT